MKRRELMSLATGLGFPKGRWSDGHTGLRSEWAGDALVSLQWMRDGQATNAPWLQLTPAKKTGVLTWPQGSGGTPDRECYESGTWDTFDAWSDNSRPQKMGWSQWTRRAVTTVLDVCPCILCGQRLSKAPGAALSPCTLFHLCRDCWGSMAQWTPTPRQWPLGQRQCGICDQAFEDAALLFEGPRGKICPPCKQGFQPIQRPWRLF